ncbi:MAG: 23S rRNA (adenine(2503)-C(2))-methyltransferase RlmN [Gammaproteobacteria bacterium]|nr:23S rRNA (adenine(2503)-C(2))-methyltransferase RlmN [Gammaproteobacteria bacterium]
MDPSVNLFDLNHTAMRNYFTGMEEQPFRATQVMKWVYHQGVTDFADMTNLSKALRDRLAGNAYSNLPTILSEKVSADGTRKWLLQVDGDNAIETVFIPEPSRGTLCISSQVGCALNCVFCATGKQGYNRNLSVAEIIGQVWLANKQLGYFTSRKRIITNIVLMGMGEPLLNFDNVIKAVELITDDLGFGLANKRVTLSTAGIVPAIIKLSQSSKISLAVSLHAANDALRDELVPINRSYPIHELLSACRRYSKATGGELITFEYVLLSGVNDSENDARELAGLLKGFPAKVNLIIFNPFPGAGFSRSSMETTDKFRDILVDSGIITITRKTRGDDIDAACGQLVGRVQARARNRQRQNRAAGEQQTAS